MLVKIKIKEKQYMKLRNVIANKKLGFAIVESRCIEPDNGNNCEVTLNCFSGDPGDLFTLGQEYKAVPDTVYMGC